MLSALPPARRRLLLGIVAALVAGVLAAVIVVVVNRPGPSNAAAPVAQDKPGPVLLVPGYGGSTSALDVLAARLRSAGRRATVVRLPRTAPATCATRPRSWTGRPGRRSLGVRRPSTWSATPPAGWWPGCGPRRTAARRSPAGSSRSARRTTAPTSPRWRGSLLPGQCPTACAQLAPTATCSARLNARTMPTGPVWVSVWTEQDQIVDPARLGPPRRRPEHPGPVRLRQGATGSQQPARDPVVQSLVLTALAPARPIQPTACPVPGSGSP